MSDSPEQDNTLSGQVVIGNDQLTTVNDWARAIRAQLDKMPPKRKTSLDLDGFKISDKPLAEIKSEPCGMYSNSSSTYVSGLEKLQLGTVKYTYQPKTYTGIGTLITGPRYSVEPAKGDPAAPTVTGTRYGAPCSTDSMMISEVKEHLKEISENARITAKRLLDDNNPFMKVARALQFDIVNHAVLKQAIVDIERREAEIKDSLARMKRILKRWI